MEKTENLNCEHVYINMDEKNEKPTKKLLHEKSCTESVSDPFCCSNIFYCLFGCCFLLCE